MGFARELADHIYFTDRGIIVEHGTPETFFEEAKDQRTKEFLSQIFLGLQLLPLIDKHNLELATCEN